MTWGFWVLGAAVFFTGAAVFSFLNVIACRLPDKKDFIKGRSMCPECGHVLSALDMIPIFGFVLRGGRCHYCKARISWRYPLCELLGGMLALLCVYTFRENVLKGLTAFTFVLLLYPVAMIDMDTMEIPDRFPVALGVLSVVSYFVFPETDLLSRAIGVVAVSVPMFLLALAIPGAFGGGDMKLMAAAGAFLGWKTELIGFAIAVLAGGAYGIWLLASKKADRKAHFAFGPFLCAGCVLALFFGEALFDAYWGLFF